MTLKTLKVWRRVVRGEESLSRGQGSGSGPGNTGERLSEGRSEIVSQDEDIEEGVWCGQRRGTELGAEAWFGVSESTRTPSARAGWRTTPGPGAHEDAGRRRGHGLRSGLARAEARVLCPSHG